MRSKDISCDELLNPEKTLERLANPEPQKGETEETDGEPPKKKNSLIVKTAVLVGILVIVGGLLLGYMIKHREPTYQQIGTRYIDDPDWGNVSEISYVVKGEVTAERLNEHLREVRETVDREELGPMPAGEGSICSVLCGSYAAICLKVCAENLVQA